jgi:hypothetical protein
MTQDEATRVAWSAYEDTICRLLPTFARGTLVAVAADLRLRCGGPWDDLPEELDARRQLLLADVIKAAEVELGGPWPIVGDSLPEAPDDLSGLV